MDYPNVISAPFRVYDNTRFYSLAHDIEELANGNILVTWEAINRVFGEIYTPDGTVVQRDFVIARSTLESVSVTATEDGGFFAVREEEQSSGLIDVKGQFFDDLGREFGAEVDLDVSGATGFPLVEADTLADGRIIVVMEYDDQITAQIRDADGTLSVAEFTLHTTTNDPGSFYNIFEFDSITPLDNGGFALNWANRDRFERTETQLMKIFDANGAVVKDTFLPIPPYSDSNRPKTDLDVLSNGDLLFTWTVISDLNNSTGIVPVEHFAIIYAEDGSAKTGPVKLVGHLANDPANADTISVEPLETGGFVAVWGTWLPDGVSAYSGVNRHDAMTFDSNGVPTSEAFQVLDPSQTSDFDNVYDVNGVVSSEGGGFAGYFNSRTDAGFSPGLALYGPVPTTVPPVTGTPQPSDYANQFYGDAGNNPIKGTALGDWIEGGDGNDKINGGAGDDYIIAGAGNDGFVRGGTGADIFQFGLDDENVHIFDFEDGIDQIALSGGLTFSDLTQTETSYNGITSVLFTASNGARLKLRDEVASDIDESDFFGGTVEPPVTGTPMPSDYANQFFGDEGNNPIKGTAQGDWIEGGDGNDKINGGAGDDYIIAGPGNDGFVRGGTGADVFEFSSGDNSIHIFDFEDGVDQIALSGGLTFSDFTKVETTFNGITSVVLTASNGDRIKLRDEVAANIDESDIFGLG